MLKFDIKHPRWKSTFLLMNAVGDKQKPGSVLLQAYGEAEEIAKEMAQEMRDALYKQQYDWEPLTEKYLDWKRKKGYDSRTLIAQKKYVRSIGVVKTEYGAMIGLTRKTRRDKRGNKTRTLDTELLRLWLEYGTHNPDKSVKMPARPHWRPKMMEIKTRRREFGLRIKNLVGRELKKALEKGRP